MVHEIAVGASAEFTERVSIPSRPSPHCISHKRGIAETWRNAFQVPIYRPKYASTQAAHDPGLARARQEGLPCHPERSEGSRSPSSQTLRCAQGDRVRSLRLIPIIADLSAPCSAQLARSSIVGAIPCGRPGAGSGTSFVLALALFATIIVF